MSVTSHRADVGVHNSWEGVCAARLPASCLHALALVRDRPDARIHVDGDTVWVRWPAGELEFVRRLLPVAGVEFYSDREGRWFRFGSRLPTAVASPADEGLPLARVLTPARFAPAPPPVDAGAPVVLRIVRGGEPQPATALACPITDLLKWGASATTAELSAVRAAHCGRQAILIGAKLPVIPSAARYWGDDLLVPVGFRAEPDLPRAALRAACGAADDELVLLDANGADVIPRAAFEPLTRAGLRLACRELPRTTEYP
jgi:MoxR-vWA-beta-propeller ternary system domain bpX2